MVNDCITVWDNCLESIRNQVNDQSYKTWFEPIRPIKLENESLTIQVPNKFFYEWLEEHYLGILKKSIRKELGDKASLQYHIKRENGSGGNSLQNGNHAANRNDIPGSYPLEDIKNPFVIPGIKKIKVDPQLNPNYLFSNYIEGDCNRLARSAGEAISNNPGGTAFNPLFIFGNVGLGKTHLAQAIGNQVVYQRSDKTVLYVTSEKFTNQIIQAIKNNAVNDFVNFYQLVDVLIVDDIQFLAHRTKTQEIFFHIFNQLHQNGKQVILTSDCAPKDLAGMEERLISRFKWGLSADLNPPQFETRMAILEAKMQKGNLQIPQNVLEFICFNIKENIRELEGVMVSLIAHSSLNRRTIDIDLAKEVIHNFVANANRDITSDKIKKIVAEHFSLSVDSLKSKSRKREIVMARQICMYLCKDLTKQPLKSIGEEFGGRDHSTVIYSCKTVQDLIDTDSKFKETMSALERKISLSIHG
jgi:chromosomal replication initiator protein